MGITLGVLFTLKLQPLLHKFYINDTTTGAYVLHERPVHTSFTWRHDHSIHISPERSNEPCIVNLSQRHNDPCIRPCHERHNNPDIHPIHERSENTSFTWTQNTLAHGLHITWTTQRSVHTSFTRVVQWRACVFSLKAKMTGQYVVYLNATMTRACTLYLSVISSSSAPQAQYSLEKPLTIWKWSERIFSTPPTNPSYGGL